MRAAVARATGADDAGDPADSAGGDVRADAHSGAGRDDRPGAGVSRVPAWVFSVAASVVANHGMGAAQSVVRRGGAAGAAGGGGEGAGVVTSLRVEMIGSPHSTCYVRPDHPHPRCYRISTSPAPAGEVSWRAFAATVSGVSPVL